MYISFTTNMIYFLLLYCESPDVKLSIGSNHFLGGGFFVMGLSFGFRIKEIKKKRNANRTRQSASIHLHGMGGP